MASPQKEPHRCTADNAQQLWNWLLTRGGLYLWRSINLSNPGASWTGPATNEDGTPKTKPNWQCENEPHRHITDPDEVLVDVPQEVKRFRVGLERGSGFQVKCTAGASRKIRQAVEKAGEHAWYEFAYDTQEAVIFVPGESLPIREYILQNLGDF